jgi:hypothetical protein
MIRNLNELGCIARHSGRIQLRAARVNSCTSLRNLHQRFFPECTLLVSDLSLGAWKSHHVAREVAAQLKVDARFEFTVPPSVIGEHYIQFSYASLIARGIDEEASGDRVIARSLALANLIVGHMSGEGPYAVVVLGPRFGLPWGKENLWLLRFLAHAFAGTNHRLVIGWPEFWEGSVTDEWVIQWLENAAVPVGVSRRPSSLIPGILEPEICLSLGLLKADGCELPLANGYSLIPPESRRAPTATSPLEYDKLAALTSNIPWLQAYAQLHGNNYFVDVSQLAQQAWLCFAEGGHDIALRLMERAVTCSQSRTIRTKLEVQLQGMRIALHRFEHALTMPDPTPAVSGEYRRFLLEAKGWCCVMAGHVARGRDYLTAALQDPSPDFSGSREQLYCLNILALGLAKSGDVRGALRIEQEIHHVNANAEKRDWPLHYVNSINMARLHRQFGGYKESEQYYCDAFATSSGGRSEGDLIYMNACMARVAAESGRHDEAARAWFRAALHFVSSSVPEAIAPRYAVMIASEAGNPGSTNTETLAHALLHNLIRTTRRLGDEDPWRNAESLLAGGRHAPPFRAIRVCNQASLQSAVAIGDRGWCVLRTEIADFTPFSGDKHRILRRCLSRLIELAAPDLDFLGTIGYVVDDRFGRDVAKNEQEHVEMCVRLGVGRSFYAGGELLLSHSDRDSLELASIVRVGELVEHIAVDGRVADVHFKRYRARRTECDEYGVIKAAVAGKSRLRELIDLDDRPAVAHALTDIRGLECRRVLHLDLPDDWRRFLTERPNENVRKLVSSRLRN